MKTILKILDKTKIILPLSGLKSGRSKSQELNSYLLNLHQLLLTQDFPYSSALL